VERDGLSLPLAPAAFRLPVSFLFFYLLPFPYTVEEQMKARGTTSACWFDGWMDGRAWGGNGMFMYIRGSVIYPGKSNVQMFDIIEVLMFHILIK